MARRAAGRHPTNVPTPLQSRLPAWDERPESGPATEKPLK
jgi:hypothetical protein